MATIPKFPNPKDPSSTLDYQFDWGAEWLNSDTIAASTFTVIPNTITIQSTSFTSTVTTIWLAGGVTGTTYSITNRITTASGRVDERTVKLQIKDL